MKYHFLFLLSMTLLLLSACSPSASTGKSIKRIDTRHLETVGFIEYVQILPCETIVKGKLDTGALTSSLAVKELQLFSKNGERWVRFTYQPNTESPLVMMECPIVYIASIKTHIGEPLQRPVVKMTLRIGNKEVETDVNLTSRENYKYPLLLGRKFLKAAHLSISPEHSLTYKSSFYKNNPSLKVCAKYDYSIMKTDSAIKVIDIERDSK